MARQAVGCTDVLNEPASGNVHGARRSRIKLTRTDLGIDRHHPRSGSIRWKSAGQADDVVVPCCMFRA